MKKVKRCIVTFLLVLTVLGTVGCKEQPPDTKPQDTSEPVQASGFTHTPELIDTAAKSILKLSTYNQEGELLATGSGVSIFETGVLVTASHVIVNMDYIIAQDEAGREYRIEFSDIKAADEDYDIAVIRVPGMTEVKPLPYETGETLRGSAVLTIGSQFGIMNMVTSGVLSGVWKTEKMQTLLFTAPVSAGASGGALFNDEGRVIGIIMGTYNNSQNLNIATPVAEAEKLYNSYLKGKK